jgi:hypothetical protein
MFLEQNYFNLTLQITFYVLSLEIWKW